MGIGADSYGSGVLFSFCLSRTCLAPSTIDMILDVGVIDSLGGE